MVETCSDVSEGTARVTFGVCVSGTGTSVAETEGNGGSLGRYAASGAHWVGFLK